MWPTREPRSELRQKPNPHPDVYIHMHHRKPRQRHTFVPFVVIQPASPMARIHLGKFERDWHGCHRLDGADLEPGGELEKLYVTLKKLRLTHRVL
jgi:hypothetical protein